MKGNLTTFIDLDHLSDAYRKKLKEVEAEFTAFRSPLSQQNLLDTFSSNYLMPQQLWHKLIQLYLFNIQNGTTSRAKLECLRQRALYQFYHDRKDRIHDEYESFLTHPTELRKLLITDPKLNKYKSMGVPFIKMKEEQLKYPHNNLEEIFKFYERNTSYKKIYFCFFQEMLQLYSKYCRFFVDDLDMMEKYKKEVASYGPIFVTWNNPFDFEHEKNTSSKQLCFSSGITSLSPISRHHKSTCAVFINGKYSIQNFSLPNTIIYYILKNSNYINLQKLHMSCKYFFAKKSTPICYNFEYYCSLDAAECQTSYIDQSIKLNTPVKNLDKLKNFYIANSLKLYPQNQGIHSLIRRFNRCEPKHIRIKKQSLTEKEFEYLVGHGNVETLSLKKVKICDTNGDLIPLENLMAKIPKIRELRLDYTRVTSETSKILCQLPFEDKMKLIKIFRINNLLKLDEFFVFINNIVHLKARLDFSCSEDAGDDFVWEFKRHEILFQKLWEGKKPRPLIAVFSSFEHEMLSHV
uniref:F-box domain-containing protein n=1 Tax=Panagrolaimus sp. ES5 TaxID=591445 RepID=A0AC34F727_9BILA